MYEVTKSVLLNNQYALSDIVPKINKLWISGELTDSERDELISLAQENANISHEINVIDKLSDLDKRVYAIEQALASGGGSDSDTEEPTEENYPAFETGKWYYAGDKVSFEGKNYVCAAPEGQVCVWSPVDYPAYWEEVTE